jgi:tetratricopeptide (TPR) repeat protein
LSPRWQISAGELFEWARPAAFVLSALCSAWVLSSARRHGLALLSVAAWTLGVLFYPFIILPIYLIVRAARRQPVRSPEAAAQAEENTTPLVEQSAGPTPEPTEVVQKPSLRLRALLPLLYLLTVLSLGALFYYREAQSVDAHLAHANQSRLVGERDKTIREYRAALKLEEDAHTRNLLGIELAASGQPEEALAEFRMAERAGEPDDELPYRIAATLDALNRTTEAAPEYRKFLATQRCAASYPDAQCAAARARLGSPP